MKNFSSIHLMLSSSQCDLDALLVLLKMLEKIISHRRDEIRYISGLHLSHKCFLKMNLKKNCSHFWVEITSENSLPLTSTAACQLVLRTSSKLTGHYFSPQSQLQFRNFL